MTQLLRLALGATVIAAGCGGGDGDGEGNGDGLVSCGDGTCTTSVMLEGQVPEDCRRCPQDCGVCEGCGNGMCDGNLAIGTGENCLSCVEDCACGADQQCFEVTSDRDAICGARMCNGDGTCDAAAGETCLSCADCGECPDACGDGTCDSAASEDCVSCAADCGCADGQRCWSESELGDPGLPQENTCGSSNPLIGAIPGEWGTDIGCCDHFSVDVASPTCYIPNHEAGDACIGGPLGNPSIVLAGTRVFLREAEAGFPDGRYAEGQVLEDGRRIEIDYGDPAIGPPEHVVWLKED
ncbi:MAG: hypothetical protein Q7R80_04040 [bacterium]|nr:hypothetical protein [bacterium]